MVDGSLTRWFTLLGQPSAGFAGLGFSTGSLYHEASAGVGLRRLSAARALEPLVGKSDLLETLSRYVRFSAMGRYGRLFGGAAYGDAVIADHSWLGQASISFAAYGDGAARPDWELEFAATIDSGLFTTLGGHAVERRFGSIALRFPYGVVETWNDWLGGTDSGPTFGLQVMFDLGRLYTLATAP